MRQDDLLDDAQSQSDTRRLRVAALSWPIRSSAGVSSDDSDDGGDENDCIGCVEVLEYAGDPEQLCSGSAVFYQQLRQCACSGASASGCADNFCMSGSASDGCTACLSNRATGCGNAYSDCEKDYGQ
jgi:hypothetical protein